MLSVKRDVVLAPDSPWTEMPPLRLAKIPTGLGTADLFVTISDDDRALLRVNLYGDSSHEIFCPPDVLVWSDRVFVGFGYRVYIIDPRKQSACEIYLGRESYISMRIGITYWLPLPRRCCGSPPTVRYCGERQISPSMV